jgi:hypothetical protein
MYSKSAGVKPHVEFESFWLFFWRGFREAGSSQKPRGKSFHTEKVGEQTNITAGIALNERRPMCSLSPGSTNLKSDIRGDCQPA